MMNTSFFKSNIYFAMFICFDTFLLTFLYFLCQRQILCKYIHSGNIFVISTLGYIKESAHFTDRIFFLIPINSHIFYSCPYFFSVFERKSCISSFSIFSLLIYISLLDSLYCNYVNLLNC